MEHDNASVLPETLTNGMNAIDYSKVPIGAVVPNWSNTVMIIYIIIAMLIGVPGNSLVLIILLKLKWKTSTDWFIIFIALCDLISLSANGTLFIKFALDLGTKPHSQFLCKFHVYVMHFIFLQSSLLIMCVGIDRYVKTCKPHSVFFTPKSGLICCVIVTSISALFNISHIFTTKVNIYGHCAFDSSKATIRTTLYVFLSIAVIVCAMALCVMYSKIAIKIRSRMKVDIKASMHLKNEQMPKRFPRRSGLFYVNRGTSDNGSQGPTSIKQTEEKSPRVNEVNSNTTEENGKMADSVQEIFCVNTVGAGHLTARGLTERGSTSRSSGMKKNQTRQIMGIKPHVNNRTKQMNKTTKTMGAITLVYVISSAVPTIFVTFLSVSDDVKHNPISRVVIFFLLRLYLINNFANPLFYIWLSLTFRKKVIESLTLCKK